MPGARVVPGRLSLGPELAPGRPSPTGLYAVAKAKSLWPLRCTLFPELADLWRHETRRVFVGSLTLSDGKEVRR